MRVLIALLLHLALACSVPGVDWHERRRAAEPAPESLTIVSWNAQKGVDARFRDELKELVWAERPDLLFLQEARSDFRRPGPGLLLFAPSWRYPWPGGGTVGVMTLSRLPARRAQSMKTRFRELLVTAPKTSLLTEHPLLDGRTLLAANVHLLNFERFSTPGLFSQLSELEVALREHEGPVVVAGDFNVWNQVRLGLVEGLMRRVGLVEVDGFPEGRRTGDLGPGWTAIAGVDPALALDRVYHRGLEPVEAEVLDYTSSDHVPLRVSFALPASERESGDQPQAAEAVPEAEAETEARELEAH